MTSSNNKNEISEPVAIGDITDFIEKIFERRGADSYLGEAVTMSQHMLQTARLAEQSLARMDTAGTDPETDNRAAGDELVVAALLHDIGHYTSDFPADSADQGIDNLHDQAGANVLARWFPALVIDCIRHHVAAKRYLCAVEQPYYDALSDASRLSLGLQGGPMSEQEVQSFAAMSNLHAILQVRRWDDQAKDPRVTTPPFSHYRPRIQRVAALHARQ